MRRLIAAHQIGFGRDFRPARVQFASIKAGEHCLSFLGRNAAGAPDAARVPQVALPGVTVPGHLKRVKLFNDRLGLGAIIEVQACFRPTHAANDDTGKHGAIGIVAIAHVPKPLPCPREQFIGLHIAHFAWDVANLAAVADLIAGDGVHNRPDAIEHHGGTFASLERL